MSAQEPITFDCPTTIDDTAFAMIVFTHPLEKVVQPIIDRIVKLVYAVRDLRPWYRGECRELHSELLSTLLDPEANNCYEMFKEFTDVAKRYHPSEFPASCNKIRELEITMCYLIRELGNCFESSVFIKAASWLRHIFASLSTQNFAFGTATDNWRKFLDSALNRFMETFRDIAEACSLREHDRDVQDAATALQPATKEDVSMALADMKRTVNKAKRSIIKDYHTPHKSEVDRRVPKGARGEQINAVRERIRQACENKETISVHKVCHLIWRNIKDGYPSPEALYDYCHAHENEF